MSIGIREERAEDVAAIRDMVRLTLGAQEADLVDALRANGATTLSLVATLDGKVVGHILYSPITVGANSVIGAALGPMCVLPDYQRRGIGSRLIETGTRTLQGLGCPYIVVLGHSEYYPRFGFRPARTHGIDCQWDVPDEVFMVRVLDDARMGDVTGLARYREEFSVFQ
jgi:putative acetyltransferase